MQLRVRPRVLVPVYKLLRRLACPCDELNVGQFRNAQVKLSVLHDAVNSARTAKLEIQLGQFEAIVSALQCPKPGRRRTCIAHHEVAVAWVTAPTDPAAQLVDLGQPEPLRA